jgi:phenylpropionate dioxygenase-like ring-hydroxylating dioxygenase large terminal subunit
VKVAEGRTLGWSTEHLAAVGACGLRDLYRAPEVLAHEHRRLFSRSWTLVASAEHLDGGRFVSTTAAGAPVVVWRDGDGACRAFHNVCRHRGLPIASGEGPTGRFLTCPYHQWSFALDGSLARVPQPEQFPDLDRAALGLRPVPVAEWHGMIFVCPAPDPVDFDALVAPLDRRLSAHLGAGLVEVGRAEYRVACNWKFLVENHIDVYHLWYLHQRSLAAYSHRQFEWDWSDRTWWSFEPRQQWPAPSGLVPGLTKEDRSGIGAHLVFPNVMVVTTDDYLATYEARPVAPDSTELTLRVRSRPGADGAPLIEAVRSFLAEDVVVCEQLQRGTASPHFSIGALAVEHEAPLGYFHAALREELLG